MSDIKRISLILTIDGDRVLDQTIEPVESNHTPESQLDSDRRIYNQAIEDVLNLRAQFGLTNSDSINVHEASRRIHELRR